MNYRVMGKTGLLVSEIGLGTAQIGGPSLIGGKYIGSPKIKKTEAIKILNLAYEAGINFYDTSDKYGDGMSERLLGEFFSKKRNKVIIATKCGITSSGERCFKKKYVKSCVIQSLINMKTDYIDIFQLTKPDRLLIESGEIYELMDELKYEGKIRFSGVSTGSDEETAKLVSDNQIDTLQVFFNLLHIKPNEMFIEKASENKIGLIIRSPLSSGILAGNYDYDTQFKEGDDRNLFLYGQTLKERVDMVNKIIEHFKLTGENSVLHFALNYLLSNNNISTVIPGVSKTKQLSEILKLCSIERMSLAESEELENFVKLNFN